VREREVKGGREGRENKKLRITIYRFCLFECLLIAVSSRNLVEKQRDNKKREKETSEEGREKLLSFAVTSFLKRGK
jgi:hypothetical protein